MVIGVAFFDIDGVIRHYDPPDAIEARWGLEPGTLTAAAFDAELGRRLTTGEISRQTRVREVGERVGCPGAALEWLSRPGHVDHSVLAIIDDLRARGRRVALFSNGSDELATELAALNITHRVDGVVNSAEIGLAKPDASAFMRACELVGTDPRCTAFVDDSEVNVDAASALGMTAHRYTDVVALRSFVETLS